MKARLCVVVGVAVAALAIGLVPSFATEFRSGGSVFIPEGTTVGDELYVSGGDVSVNGSVSGDLLAVGGRISTPGTIGRSACLAGGNVDVGGKVGGNLRAAGGYVTVSGTIADNASIFGGTIILPKTAEIKRDLQAGGGSISFDGKVGRHLRVIGGQVRINGRVGGNLEADVGRLTLGPAAVIGGDLIYTSPRKASVSPGAVIKGKTVHRVPAPKPEKRAPPALKPIFWLAGFLALFIVGVVIIALAPRGATTAADRLTGAPWISLLTGFILLVVVPAVVVLIMMTLIGIPLALILLAAYLLALYLSRMFAALAIGRWLFARFGKPRMSLYVDLLVGLLILWLLMAIPFVGWVVSLLAVLIGIGAVASHLYTSIRTSRAEE